MARRTHAGTGNRRQNAALDHGLTARVRAALVVALGAFSLAACGKTRNVTPADVTMQFYVTLELGGVREVPEPRALIALEPYLTGALAEQLRAARTLRDTPLAPGSTDKPPFTDGNPFSSLFEGHSTYRIGTTTMRGDTALVTVGFSNTEQKPAVEWKDTVVLVSGGSAASRTWRIDDVRYGNNWEFGYRGTLRGVLRDGLAGASRSTP